MRFGSFPFWAAAGLVGSAAACAGAGAVCSVAAGRALMRRSSRRRFQLRGKVALVTGASRGLGLVLAREFARRGCAVAVCARDEQELARVRDEFSALGPNFLAIACDLTERDQVARMVSEVEAQLGPIDVLVNNAGTILVAPAENQQLEDLEAAMRANFWSAVYTTLAVLPSMKGRRAGRIVNIGSIGGKIAVPHLLGYSASKFALVGFSKGLRAELARDGVVVTTVAPGLMRTGSPRNAQVKSQHPKEYTWFMLSDSLPGISMNAVRAARRIVDACVSGKAEVILGLPAKLAVAADALAPNLFSAILSGGNSLLLPEPGGRSETKRGFESETPLTKSLLGSLTRRAELRNNQV